MKNKILKSMCSFIVITFILVIMIASFSFTANASEGYSGTPTMPKQINNENYTQFGLSSNSYNGYYAITTAEELIAWFDYLRDNNGNASAILLADITVNTENMVEMGDKVLSGELEAPTAYTCSAIPALRGVFDGRGHTISGLYMTPNSNGYGGLFYKLYGKIQNLTLANSYISGGNAYTGGICADTWLCDGIFNCKLDSTVKVIGSSAVGGIIGYADRITISNCVSMATVTCYDPSNPRDIGALCGDYESKYWVTFSNCYYTNTDLRGLGDNYTSTNLDGMQRVSVASHTCVAMQHPASNAACYAKESSEYTDCMVCGQIMSGIKNIGNFKHEWQSATCIAPKTCRICQTTEGEIDENNHGEIAFAASANSINGFCSDCDKPFGAITLNAPDYLYYDGSAKSASVSGEILGIATPEIIYTQGSNVLSSPPSQIGEYTASITLGTEKASINFTITPKIIPTAQDFTVSTLSNPTFDGQAKYVDVTTQAEGMGIITVKYFDASGNPIEAPINAGEYTVKLDIDEGIYYAAISNLEVGKFTIEKASLTVTAEDKIDCIENSIEYSYKIDGLVGEDTLTFEPTFSVNTDCKTEGEFEITVSGVAEIDNYQISYVNGKLTLTEHDYHKYEKNDADTHKAECACGTVSNLGHTWKDGIITKEATCTEDGQLFFECFECGESYNEIIPAKQHSDENNDGKCDACDTEISSDTEIDEKETEIESEKEDKKDKEDNAVDASNNENMGCASSASISALAIAGIAGTALLFKKKKHNEE